MKRTITFAAAAILLAAYASQTGAQQQLRAVEMKGTIEASSPGVISVKCDGQEIYLKIDPRNTKVECSGTAEASYLQPGLLVRFRAELDKKGVAQDDVSELSIVSPSEKNDPGITSDDISDDKEKRKSKKDGGGGSLVVGTIKQFKDGTLVVQAGGRAVRATLADKPDISVELDDYTMAEAGDKIQFKGRMPDQQLQQGPAQALADEITITFTEPFAGDKKSKPKGKSGKSSKGSKSSPKKR